MISLVPYSEENLLLVQGTESRIQQLEKIIAQLDKPEIELKVEVEARYIQLSAEDEKQLGLVELKPLPMPIPPSRGGYSPSEKLILFGAQGLKPFRVAQLSTEAREKLETLETQKKALTLWAPRVTTISTQTSYETTQITQNAALNTTATQKPCRKSVAINLPEDVPDLWISKEYKFTVTPVIDTNNSLTMKVSTTTDLTLNRKRDWSEWLPLPRNTAWSNTSESLSLKHLDGFQSVLQLKEGETVVLSGLTPQMAPPAESGEAMSTNLILLLTPRISQTVEATK